MRDIKKILNFLPCELWVNIVQDSLKIIIKLQSVIHILSKFMRPQSSRDFVFSFFLKGGHFYEHPIHATAL